jgi:3-phenylpropionate/trans-cinnamate dioxygenase ferredoxin subunit
LITALEAHPDPEVGDQVRALLEAIDTVHRTALSHLVGAVQGMAGEAFMNRLTADPAVRLLLMSYELLAVDRRLLAEEALDAVRGHLHGRGIDVELLEVVGGAVYVKLHGLESSAISEEAVRHDLEEALRAGLLGFQELVLRQREVAAAGGLVQLGGLRPAHRPVYRRALPSAELKPGSMKAVEVEGLPLLLVNLDGDLFAVRNRCGESPLPLEFGTLEAAEIRCSWHGCRYDVRTGRRLDAEGDHLAVFPVSVQENEIMVAVGVEPVEAA